MTSLVLLLARRFTRELRADGFARFTSAVSFLAILLGSLALVLSISILTGYEEKILSTATEFTSHIEIRNSLDDGIDLSQEQVAEIAKIPTVRHIDTLLVREALVRQKGSIEGVAIYGMSDERMLRTVRRALLTGSLPTGTSCILGADLATRMNVAVGDTLLFYASNAQKNSPIVFTAAVSGIVSTGMQSVDETMVAMRYNGLTEVMGTPNATPTMLAIELTDPNRAEIAAIHLLTMLPRYYYIFTWKDRFASVANWIELQKKPIPIVLGLISIVAAFTVVSTLLVAIVLKTRSLAVLGSLGLTNRDATLVVLLQSLRLGVTGSVAGAALGWIAAYVQHTWALVSLDGAVYYVSVLPMSIAPTPFLVVPLVGTGLSVIAAIVPMIVARRISIVASLRFN